MIDETVVPTTANFDAGSVASSGLWSLCSGVDVAVAGLSG